MVVGKGGVLVGYEEGGRNVEDAKAKLKGPVQDTTSTLSKTATTILASSTYLPTLFTPSVSTTSTTSVSTLSATELPTLSTVVPASTSAFASTPSSSSSPTPIPSPLTPTPHAHPTPQSQPSSIAPH
ncbi:hypothetical protein BDV93DRAFT_557837 [Ceratobasidium sp. AG-I]|nr:hypothetical protein BDV93DRAFT_557837 [Ceratobasidium sp. AG-I]